MTVNGQANAVTPQHLSVYGNKAFMYVINTKHVDCASGKRRQAPHPARETCSKPACAHIANEHRQRNDNHIAVTRKGKICGE